jgi:hypothetical protein
MTEGTRDLILGVMAILKNIVVILAIVFLVTRTGQWWPLFLILGMSSIKTGDVKEDEDE